MRLSARRADALTLRAKASLAVLRAAPAEHEHLRDVVAQDITQLEREGRAHLRAEAALLRAGLAACDGDDEAGGRHLDAAVSGFEATGMSLSAIVVRRLRAYGGRSCLPARDRGCHLRRQRQRQCIAVDARSSTNFEAWLDACTEDRGAAGTGFGTL